MTLPHRLMVNPTWQELLELKGLSRRDGVVYGHHGFEEDLLAKYKANGYRIFRYLNVWTYPEESWIGGGNWWFDFIDQFRMKHRAFYADAGGMPIRDRYYNRVLINWKLIFAPQNGDPHEVASFILGSIKPEEQIFLDQFWPIPQEWMFRSIDDYNAAFAQCDRGALSFLAHDLGRVGGVLANGDDQISHSPYLPRYLEHSEWNWERSLEIWKEDERNVLSVDVGNWQFVLRAIDEWKLRGGWLGFGSQAGRKDLIDRVYELAAAERTALLAGIPSIGNPADSS